MIGNESLPAQTDDVQDQGPSEQELLDAVMRNSPIMEDAAVPLPDEEIEVMDPEESETEDPDSEEAVSEEEEEVEEDEEEIEGEDAADEAATEEPEVYTSEDLDLDAKVKVKVDGEELDVSFGDLIKGYQTDAHLSKQGRELGEARKALDTEREEKLKEVEELTQATSAMLFQTEQHFGRAYQDIEKEIQKARDEGDTYNLPELKDKREQIQQSYWNARRQREGLVEAVQKQQQEAAEAAWQEQINNFQQEIPNLIPDFDEKVANDIRQFAVDEGIDPDILDQITDPKIVKFVDDFRRLKQNVDKGTAKRRTIPSKKAIPTKKSKSPVKKQAAKQDMVKARAFREDASADDQMAFLRQHASKTLNL